MYNSAVSIAKLMATDNIVHFQGNVSSAGYNAGVHGGGHYILGGNSLDFFASVNDPAFFVHHAMLDKVWTDWQALDPGSRSWALNGTDTAFDPIGATEITLGFVQDWGFLAEPRETAELMRVGFEGFCYRYE